MISILFYAYLEQIVLWQLLFMIQGFPNHIKSKHVLLSFLNIGIISSFIFGILSQFNLVHSENYFEIIVQTLFFFIVQEYWTYFVHKTFHRIKFLYNHIHVVHHLYKGDHFISAYVMHPLESVLFVGMSFVVGPILFYHFNTIIYESILLWTLLGTFYFTWSHTGLSLPYMPSTGFHHDHHIYPNKNFGSTATPYIIPNIE